jgi:hypothetical protein
MFSLTARHRTTILAVAGVTGVYLLTAWAAGAGVVDDTYIFLRYARNIWEGAGPVFNDGERVEGYTSPLWLAVLTGLFRLPVDPPAAAVAASASAGYALVLVLLLRREGSGQPWSPLGALFLASNPSFVYWAWSGMDTALFTLFVVLTLLVLERDLAADRHPLRTGILLALAAATRLEALWLVPLAGAILLPRRGSSVSAAARAAALCLPLIVVLLPHVLWRHAYYDAWLPNTFAAKVGIPRGVLLLKGLTYIAKAALAYAPLLLALGFAVQRARAALPRTLITPITWASWLVLYAAIVGGDHFALFRFLVPALATVSVMVGRLAPVLIEQRRNARQTGVMALAILGVNAFVLAGPPGAAGRSEVAQATAWANTGRWCAEHLPAGSIASMVVGAIPYYCDRETIDLLGLVDAHIARYGRIRADAPAGHQKYDTDYVLARQPDFIFFLSAGMPARPLFRTIDERRQWLDEKGFALEDLVTDPRTLERYVYRAERLGNGRWVEFLERRR